MPSEKHELLQKLNERLSGPEHLEIEFKASRFKLPRTFWETVSAFANTVGGWIILGIDESATDNPVQGVVDAEKQIQEIHTQMRNLQKISSEVATNDDISVETMRGQKMILVRVRAAPRAKRPVYIGNNPFDGTFVRRAAADHRCTEEEVRRMIREADPDKVDSAALDLGIEALDPGSVSRYRRLHGVARPQSPWHEHEDARFLEAIGALAPGGERITVAGLLMLGREEHLRAWRTRHLIDFRVLGSDQDRWEDRVPWGGNLLGAYSTIYPKLVAEVPIQFQLRAGVRVEETAVHVVLREALVNLLVHTDYAERAAALVVRSPEGFLFRNPGDSRVPPEDLLAGDRSDPRNPWLMAMFRYVGWAEEAGTGLTQIVRLWRAQGLELPKIDTSTERYEFSISLRYSHLLSQEDREWLKSLEGKEWAEAEQLALVMARNEGHVSNGDLRNRTGQHPSDATKTLTGLRDRGFLTLAQGGRNAFYVLGPKSLSRLPQLTLGIEEAEILRLLGSLEGSSEGNSGGRSEGNSGGRSEDSFGGRSEGSSESRDSVLRLASLVRRETRVDSRLLATAVEGLCSVRPLSLRELSRILDRSVAHLRGVVQKSFAEGRLGYLYPHSPRHPGQKYIATIPPSP